MNPVGCTRDDLHFVHFITGAFALLLQFCHAGLRFRGRHPRERKL
jgi:hypothetical protein